jgi:hypothetical protein
MISLTMGKMKIFIFIGTNITTNSLHPGENIFQKKKSAIFPVSLYLTEEC